MNFSVFDFLASSPWAPLVVAVLAFVLVLWLVYRVVKAAVREGVRYSGFAQSSGAPLRRELDPKYDFVFTQPRHE